MMNATGTQEPGSTVGARRGAAGARVAGRRVLRGAAGAALVAGLIGGCSPTPQTEIVVLVSTDLARGTVLRSVELIAQRSGAPAPMLDRTYRFEDTRFALPGGVVLVASDPADSRPLTVRVIADLGGRTLRQDAVVRFLPERTIYLQMTLSGDCVEQRCDAGLTCRLGACVAPERAPVTETPPTITLRPDAATDAAEAGALDDLGDTGADAPIAPGDVPDDACAQCGSDACVRLGDDPFHCGRCGNACRVTEACTAGVCTACPPGQVSCGRCTILASDPSNCGACGRACVAGAHQVVGCAGGGCIAVCAAGYADCDGSSANGCETSTAGDPSNCGGCHLACPNAANAAGVCAAGVCAFACATGFADCDGVAGNGCEVNLRTDASHCGACAMGCPSPTGATATCAAGACGIACQEGRGDCDGLPGNGCETNVRTEETHCGACATACVAPPNATGACNGGMCGRGACEGGYADCNASAADGCEVATASDPSNCGGCGTRCSAPHARSTCAAGACGLGPCDPGYADCDGLAANGCEARTEVDVAQCGACGNRCAAGQVCSNGVCAASCAGGTPDLCAGACTDLASDPLHCGGCATTCVGRPNSQASCALGACGLTCSSGYADCNTVASDGCEVSTQTDLANCGGCGRACPSPPRGQSVTCARGACGFTCATGYSDCDGVAGNGCEAALATSASNCGACGNACPSPAGATATCRAAACGFACNAGFADCDGVAANGCEVDLRTSPTHCGACANRCASPANAAATCAGSACGYGCAAGYADCDGAAANGCEVNTQTDATHCGTCATACATRANATTTCGGGACATACRAGYGDCDGNQVNGCETDVRVTLTSCGACGSVCSPSNATGACVGGSCGVGACAPGFGDCDGSALNGCETPTNTNSNCGACGAACAGGTHCAGATCVSDCPAGSTLCSGVCRTLQTDASNCGACDSACPARANGTATCVAGACGVACDTGFANCDGSAANGCEVNLLTDPAHCGACTGPGASCSLANAVASCAAGSCSVASCASGYQDCNRSPTDGCETSVATVSNCGACGRVCSVANGTASCAGGACAIACGAGYGNCNALVGDGCEANLQTDLNHCGGCGVACGSGQACVSGQCCAMGQAVCGGACTTLATSASHCGACGAACTYANAAGVCTASACSLGSCLAGWVDCDGVASNGCEVNPQASAANCGSCGNVCPAPQYASAACTAGVCGLGACNAGRGNCDGSAVNGCETNTLTSLSNCGLCGRACATPANASPGCAAGVCGIGACAAGWGSCDGNATNGCETNTLVSNVHCGTCGTACGDGTLCSGGACVAIAAPRPQAPLSTSTVTASRPTLRWILPAGGVTTGAFVEMCRDRAMSASCITPFTVTGTSGAPTVDLPAGLHYWRLTGTALAGARTGTTPSPVWQFNVPRMLRSTTNTSWGTTPDFNGDGYADVAVGAPQTTAGGAVSVYYGSASGVITTAALTLTARTDSTQHRFGYYVSSAGDVNGDGFGDLLVGIRNQGSAMGYARVYLGGSAGLSATPTTLTGVTAHFGDVVASAGDLDNDGYGDIIASDGTVGGPTDTVYVFRGGAGGVSTTGTATLTNANVPFGGGLAGGDYNGDGYADVAVFGNDQIVLHYGTAAGLGSTAASSPASFYNCYGIHPAGDVNGDGYADLLAVGANNPPSRVYRGGSGGLGTTYLDYTEIGTGGVGRAAGDLDGDGYGDVVIGPFYPNPSAGGSASIYAGRAGGINTTPFNLYDSDGWFGLGVNGAGDVNGDGYADLLVGAPGGGNFARVYPGSSSGVSSATYSQLSGTGNFGQGLARIPSPRAPDQRATVMACLDRSAQLRRPSPRRIDAHW